MPSAASSTAAGESRLSAQSMFSIPLSTLSVLGALDFDLYLVRDAGSTPVLYRERHCKITEHDLDGLRSGGVLALYASLAERANYFKCLRSKVNEVIACSDLEPAARFELLQQCAQQQMQTALRLLDTDRTVDACVEVGAQLAVLVSTSKLLPGCMWSLMQHDPSTFTHSLNVAGFATVLAKLLGVTERSELARIAVGGLLHDYGKREISPLVLRKAGPLSPPEKELIRMHPQRGFEKLCHRSDLEWWQLMMIYQHHEAPDGSGYPVRITSEDIHWQARVCTVADVFDALTCERPYRMPFTVSAALQHLEERAGSKFDREMVQCWTSAIR